MTRGQFLFTPYRYCEVLCGYKTEGYRKFWGYAHFGIDTFCYDNPNSSERGIVLASGNGTVVKTGLDAVGNVVVIIYKDVQFPDGSIKDLVARYFHLATILVKEGEAVTHDTPIGIEGNTGTTAYHLHLEFYIDCAYPCHSPQVKGSTIIKRGTDTTVDPLLLLHKRRDQVMKPSRYGRSFNNPHDTTMRMIHPTTGG